LSLLRSDLKAVSDSTSQSLPIDPAARRAFIAALAAVVLGALDLTVIATLLPRIVIDLEINTADIDRYVWVVNAYLLAYLVSIPLMGKVSDLVGRRVAFELSIAVFLLGSIGCALATDLTTLIAARAVQGAGGGALLPVTMALVGDLLPAGRRYAALGIVGAVDTLGWVLGPIWGAAVVGVLSGASEPWRWVFYVNIPVGLLVAAGVGFSMRGMERSKSEPHPFRQLDVPGVALLGAAMVCLNVGLSSGGEFGNRGGSALRALGGTSNPLADYLVPLLAASAIFVVAFIWWESRTPHPAVPLRLFREPRFRCAIVANFLVGSALIAVMVDVPIVVSILVDQSRVSTMSALMLAPFTLVMAALSLTGGMIASRLQGKSTASVGLVLVVIGFCALWVGLRNEHLIGMVPGLVVAGAGFGLVVAPLSATVIDSVPSADRGIAAGLTLVARLLGMTIGISALTAIGVRRLQGLTDRLEPIVQGEGESTAQFLLRQSEFIQNHVIPLSIQVIRETFLVAAAVAALAFIPIGLIHRLGAERRSLKANHESAD
jgi:MFS transporter, DHA2 family, triacylglyceride efflux pump